MKKIFLAIITTLICFTACNAASPELPIKLPFEVHKAGAVVMSDLHVKKTHSYWFDLTFLHNASDDEAEQERVKKLVGSAMKNKEGKQIEPGIAIPIKITINVMDTSGVRNVVEKELLVGEMFAGGAGGYRREIGYIKIPAGKCRITFQSMKDIPELANRKIILGIRYQARAKY
ncbi:MAG: DUF5625 family protein [Smithellaceae bacterium]